MTLRMNTVYINWNDAQLTGYFAEGGCTNTSLWARDVAGLGVKVGEWCGLPGRRSSRDCKMGNKMNKLNAKRLLFASRILKLLS
jgi:hypothetical protein